MIIIAILLLRLNIKDDIITIFIATNTGAIFTNHLCYFYIIIFLPSSSQLLLVPILYIWSWMLRKEVNNICYDWNTQISKHSTNMVISWYLWYYYSHCCIKKESHIYTLRVCKTVKSVTFFPDQVCGVWSTILNKQHQYMRTLPVVYVLVILLFSFFMLMSKFLGTCHQCKTAPDYTIHFVLHVLVRCCQCHCILMLLRDPWRVCVRPLFYGLCWLLIMTFHHFCFSCCSLLSVLEEQCDSSLSFGRSSFEGLAYIVREMLLSYSFQFVIESSSEHVVVAYKSLFLLSFLLLPFC